MNRMNDNLNVFIKQPIPYISDQVISTEGYAESAHEASSQSAIHQIR